ncbi:unnamed protein product [Adineta steineri]|uniref:DUF302 domain-containing protein n=1 Tax=Adineta steineri TaxID=433720 RepID=A0A814PGG5_9BILA|nr:unnamed protein product [Adineta steineri]CAF1104517.1 unnamed protein product [Adineta steineri]
MNDEQYTIHHIEHISSRSFEEVITDFGTLVGNVENGTFRRLSAAANNEGDFSKRVREHEGKSGFMQFLLVDHGSWLPHVGINGKKARMYTIGNPLIAETMLKYDIRVGLNVPVRLFIYENSSDNTARLAYDLPSSLMSRLKNEEVTIAVQKLDAKLGDLCENVANAFKRQN